MTSERRRLLLALTATAAIVLPLGWMWNASRLPGTYSVMDMGYVDPGGGRVPSGSVHAHGMHSGGGVRSVKDLVADPRRPADVRYTLTARKQRFTLPDGRSYDGYTVNGTSPGPVIRAVQGQLVEVRLVNDNVADGVTLHWHGVDVPNAVDGVAGVTQDAVPVGGSHTYRFVAEDAGTYWYHSHQLSHTQVQRGLLGPVVITPARPDPKVRDEVALLHIYGGKQTLNGRQGEQRVDVLPGTRVRVRVINTDNGAASVWASGSPYVVRAVDGVDLSGPTPLTDRVVRLTAGARVDVEVTAPARVELGGSGAVVLGDGVARSPRPRTQLDLLTYGTPAPIGLDPAKADRRFTYSIGRRPGFVHGRPGVWWSINGKLFPNIPMYLVEEGDVVTMRLKNSSGDVHPMHLHGHHAVVLSRNGVKATGSPWWVDSLDVGSGDEYEIAFRADNPGIWADHCHNLPHASDGLIAHLMYAGITEPYRIGGPARNAPE